MWKHEENRKLRLLFEKSQLDRNIARTNQTKVIYFFYNQPLTKIDEKSMKTNKERKNCKKIRICQKILKCIEYAIFCYIFEKLWLILTILVFLVDFGRFYTNTFIFPLRGQTHDIPIKTYGFSNIIINLLLFYFCYHFILQSFNFKL